MIQFHELELRLIQLGWKQPPPSWRWNYPIIKKCIKVWQPEKPNGKKQKPWLVFVVVSHHCFVKSNGFVLQIARIKRPSRGASIFLMPKDMSCRCSLAFFCLRTGRTPLLAAVRNGRLDLVRTLCAFGALSWQTLQGGARSGCDPNTRGFVLIWTRTLGSTEGARLVFTGGSIVYRRKKLVENIGLQPKGLHTIPGGPKTIIKVVFWKDHYFRRDL